jgi:hypothetical protein
MVNRHARRRTRTIAAGAAIVVGLSLVGVAGPAAAQSTSPSPAAICVRAGRQWDRLVAANQKAKAAFTKAQALRNRLIRAGRVVIAHRLDQRLAHLRDIHAALVVRVRAIATRIQGRCAAHAPTLLAF